MVIAVYLFENHEDPFIFFKKFLFLQIVMKFASIPSVSVSSSIIVLLRAITFSQCAVCPCEKMKVALVPLLMGSPFSAKCTIFWF
ncbi:Os05g0169500 [Oryza sativa Japonica Group]|uniref:Os05g0169500 protein n=2 Tax=Oryza sativa subsp. japonica TaxID=39947 RepID=Q0DKE6_ORYSJ|nr:hypothetical protein EE612_027376 [Oryza sativa]BAF16677.1 Os05g0169500 [Oryza sativa Japonica Group]BAS92470.1 Os05g0169500 [Oryza sativa Japonica Group]|eukprot:NP_001054763.1 Os05g0169500 [Oryza sativa Japonica Group]